MACTLRRPRLSRLAMPALLALAVFGTPAVAVADTGYKLDLFFRAGYERQVDARTCTAASTAMMLNFAARQDLGLDQPVILGYAQELDALDDAVQRGSDPLGWSLAATYFSRYGVESAYAWRAFGSEIGALRAAAFAIARFGKPVGLTISHGRHAVVMTGFEATADPLHSWAWSLRAVYLSDPYGASHHRYAPASTSPLNTYLETDATRAYDRAWYGKFVIVAPEG